MSNLISDFETCDVCHGEGCDHCHLGFRNQTEVTAEQVPCPHCEGDGCEECEGEGVLYRIDTSQLQQIEF